MPKYVKFSSSNCLLGKKWLKHSHSPERARTTVLSLCQALGTGATLCVTLRNIYKCKRLKVERECGWQRYFWNLAVRSQGSLWKAKKTSQSDEESACLHLLDFLRVIMYLRLKGIFFIRDREHRHLPIIALNKEVWNCYVSAAVNEVAITGAKPELLTREFFRYCYCFWAVCQGGCTALFLPSDNRTLP